LSDAIAILTVINTLLTAFLLYISIKGNSSESTPPQMIKPGGLMKAFAKAPDKKKPKINDDSEAWKIENKMERNTNG